MTSQRLVSDSVYTASNNRETWLLNAVDLFRPDFAQARSPLAEVVRVSVGIPPGGRRVLGVCFTQSFSADDVTHHIYISPQLTNPLRVLDVLLHELCHVATVGDGHGVRFGRLARGLGLQGPLTATTASHELVVRLLTAADLLGTYPHRELVPHARPNKQSTRMLKVECPTCGYLVRTTARWLAVGIPTCPCGTAMQPA